MSQEKYYVGIGASAGGLEALESFFKNTSDDTGLVFIVIQHLSPDYKSLMSELLSRHTNMKIYVAKDGMETLPNNIYLIPPRNNMTIYNGKLYLEEQKPKGHHVSLPIDIFFRSLAKDQGKYAIAVILSGTGSDGTLGVREIKESGGMIMVQDEISAKFDGMPKSSIATGLVDYILTPQEMPREIMGFIKHPSMKDKANMDSQEAEKQDDLTKICYILRNHANIDFSQYKENTMVRRIERRVVINRCSDVKEYVTLLKDSDKEKETLFRELLIGVTSFFRDKDAFDSIVEKVIAKLDYAKKQIRIWSAGCSTGEEVYSLAILINEYLAKNNIQCEVKCFATDVDIHALEIAGIGYYPDSIISDIDQSLITKYFTKKDEGYQVNEFIRKQVVFAKHNILKDPPFSKLDLLVCRNLFIYLKSEYQQRILSSFYYSLNSSGYLFLGSSESLGDVADAFETIDNKWKIYKFREGYRPLIQQGLHMVADRVGGLASHDRDGFKSSKSIWFEELLVQVLQTSIAPSIIIDQNDNILQVIGDVSKYMGIQSGRFSNKLSSNMSKDLILFVNNLIRRIRSERKPVMLNNIKRLEDDLTSLAIRGSLIELSGNDYFLLSFDEVQLVEKKSHIEIDMTNEGREKVKQLELELQQAREGLQASIEELETSNEELQSSNEELIASNEELQSTNEELQSVNEELYTVNNEHQAKIEQLSMLNSDLNNLLKNTEVGALYLDYRLCIRRITPLITKATRIMESDIGRPISHIQVMEEYPEISSDIEFAMENLVGVEREVYGKNDKWWLVRIRPFRTQYNAVDGVILIMIDITVLKTELKNSKALDEKLSSILKIGQIAWWEYDLVTGKVRYSDGKATMLGYTVEEFPIDVYEICQLIHPEDYDETMKAMRDYMHGITSEWNISYRIKTKTGDYMWYHDVGHITERDVDGKPLKISGSVTDVTEIMNLRKETFGINRDMLKGDHALKTIGSINPLKPIDSIEPNEQ